MSWIRKDSWHTRGGLCQDRLAGACLLPDAESFSFGGGDVPAQSGGRSAGAAQPTRAAWPMRPSHPMANAWTMPGWNGPLAHPAGLPARLSGEGRTVGTGLRWQKERLTRSVRRVAGRYGPVARATFYFAVIPQKRLPAEPVARHNPSPLTPIE